MSLKGFNNTYIILDNELNINTSSCLSNFAVIYTNQINLNYIRHSLPVLSKFLIKHYSNSG